ncbi:MAG TPA: NUDIX domain-containing protein [Patescibacteria group bacterium]|nr:NUDIX domain-containing protein [Patescibacteria group bacterium]
MKNGDLISQKFYSGGFLYNPQTKSVLLHQRDGNTKIEPHKWAFFGGLNEGNETPVECFIRELEEEIGMSVSFNEVQDLCDYLNTKLNTHRYVFFVESLLTDTPHLILGEGAGFAWIPLEKVFEYDLTDKTRQDLEFFLQHKKDHP